VSSPTETPTIGGFRRKNIIIIGVVAAAIWAFAIQTGSLILMGIVGGLTLLLAGLLVWALLLMRRQKRLNAMLEGAVASPEARREAMAKLENAKDAKEIPNVFARAQLTAADDPARALEMLEAIEIKNVPPQMQDDFAYLRAQLCLNFGRAKDARPMVDYINLENPQRKEQRSMLAGVVAEAWARTGKHQDALKLLDTVKIDSEKDEVQFQLQVAKAFALFASGKTRAAKEELERIAAPDVNRLGRFVAPQFKVHPNLQRLAREIAQKNPQLRKNAQMPPGQRRGRPR
jgi:hypothetical protein